jgi:hypothetical protein
VTCVALSGCSGKSSTTESTTTTIDTSDPSVVLEDWAIPFVPDDDSFSFENFGGGEPPADLTVNMARRMYGDDQVCQTVVDNQCTPFPVILQLIAQANRSMKGGLCEGLAVLSLRLSGDVSSIQTFQQVQEVSQLVKDDPALMSELAFWYVTQFAPEVQERASVYRQMEPMDLARILLEDFEESAIGGSATGFTIGIYSDEGGHAVTPYRVEQTVSGYRIYIYDSNWPTSERWIDVTDSGWTYALAATNPSEASSAWSGGAGTMELTPMTARKPPFNCPFCPTEGDTKSGTLLTVASSGSKQATLQVQTSTGQRLGYYDGEFLNEIPGATFRYLISGPSTSDPVLVSLPATVDAFTADVGVLNTSGSDIVEEESNDRFSLLILDEERSLQVEATLEEQESDDPFLIEEDSLINFSEESLEIGDVSEATVSIAIDALEAEIELDEGQEIEVVFSEDDVETSEEELETMEIGIIDEDGTELAEIEIDLTDYIVEEGSEDDFEPPPLVIEVYYDEEVGEIVQEEDEIEAWVATDAEYFIAVSEGRLEEVLGDSWVEEYEEEEYWEPEESLTEILMEIDDEYWEDEYWDEVDYDEEWYLEEEEWDDWGDDDPLAGGSITTPILVSTENTERSLMMRSWTTTTPNTTSTSTTNTLTFTDSGGTMTEIWRTTIFTTLTDYTTFTEKENTMGLIQTWNTSGEITTETTWGEPTTEITTVTTTGVNMEEFTELIATDRECIWRENQTGTMIMNSGSGAMSTMMIGTSMTNPNMMTQMRTMIPTKSTNTMMNPMMNMIPTSMKITKTMMIPMTAPDKPSGCATPGDATVTQRQDGTNTTTTTDTVTSEAADGYWHDYITTTDTVVTTYTDITTVVWSDGYVQTTESDPYSVTVTSSSTSSWSNDCALTGGNNTVWTGFGDFCIADIETFNSNEDSVTFTITETTTVTILAETELTCDGWPGNANNGEADYGDPYIYLYDSNNNLIEKDDDDGCSCGNNCGSDGNCWDSWISRELTAGTYTVKAKVYNNNTTGWYKLTIDTAD